MEMNWMVCRGTVVFSIVMMYVIMCCCRMCVQQQQHFIFVAGMNEQLQPLFTPTYFYRIHTLPVEMRAIGEQRILVVFPMEDWLPPGYSSTLLPVLSSASIFQVFIMANSRLVCFPPLAISGAKSKMFICSWNSCYKLLICIYQTVYFETKNICHKQIVKRF